MVVLISNNVGHRLHNKVTGAICLSSLGSALQFYVPIELGVLFEQLKSDHIPGQLVPCNNVRRKMPDRKEPTIT